MTRDEAEKVVEALLEGKQFEFSNMYDGVMEQLNYSKTEKLYVHDVKYAYYHDRNERMLFTREEMIKHLEQGFAFESFVF